MFFGKLLLILGLSVATLAQAQDNWPRFRGPNGSGISRSEKVPVKWSDSAYRWKQPLPGKGHSSPVVWRDHIYVTCGDTNNGDRYLLCFKTADGSKVWEKKISSRVFPQHRDNSFASSTPAVDDTGIYWYWATPEEIQVTALTLTGEEKWMRKLGSFKGQHGSGASPVLLNNVVWLNNDQDGPSALLGLDARSGELRFQVERLADKVSYGTPCVLSREGQPAELVFAASSHGLTSVDPLKGTVNWDCTNLFSTRVVASPISSDGLVIATSGEGGVGRRLVALRPPSKQESARVAYDLKRDIPQVPTPLALNGHLYLLCDNGLLRCLRAATGEAVWQERLPERFYSSPVAAGNRLYLTGKTGLVFVVATGEKYELVAQNSIGEPSFATPAIANDSIYFRTHSSLIAIGPR